MSKNSTGRKKEKDLRKTALRLKVRDKLFSKSGDLKIKCTAAIDTIYWRSNEESIQVIMVLIILMVIMVMVIHIVIMVIQVIMVMIILMVITIVDPGTLGAFLQPQYQGQRVELR